MFKLHHFCFTLAIGKPYTSLWHFQRYSETQQDRTYGKRLVKRFAFGWLRWEYSTYLFR